MKKNGLAKRILTFTAKLPVYSVITLLIGLWLLIFPERALEIALRISGLVLLIYAFYRLVATFILDTYAFESTVSLFSTVMTLALGILLLSNPLFITGVISTLFGVYLVITGIFSLRRSSVLKEHLELFGIAEDKASRRIRTVTSVITLALGLILIIFPLAAEKFTAVVTGICLMVEGAKSIILKVIELLRAPKPPHTNDIETDFIDKSDN